MKIIGLGLLHAYCDAHPDTRRWIENWIADTKHNVWKTPQEIRNRYNSASFLPENFVIFNVRGNEHRLTVQIAYNSGVIAVKRIESHAQYSRRKK